MSMLKPTSGEETPEAITAKAEELYEALSALQNDEELAEFAKTLQGGDFNDIANNLIQQNEQRIISLTKETPQPHKDRFEELFNSANSDLNTQAINARTQQLKIFQNTMNKVQKYKSDKLVYQGSVKEAYEILEMTAGKIQ